MTCGFNYTLKLPQIHISWCNNGIRLMNWGLTLWPRNDYLLFQIHFGSKLINRIGYILGNLVDTFVGQRKKLGNLQNFWKLLYFCKIHTISSKKYLTVYFLCFIIIFNIDFSNPPNWLQTPAINVNYRTWIRRDI